MNGNPGKNWNIQIVCLLTFFSLENFQNPDKIEAFKSIIENCCKIEQELKDELAIIQNFQCESIEEFDREFAKVLKNSKHDLPSAKTADRYQKFVKDLEDIQFVSDTQANASIAEAAVQVDDMQIEEENIRIDPITKNPIQKPVVNKNCNHIYDCTSITEAIRLNPRIKWVNRWIWTSYLKKSFLYQMSLHGLQQQKSSYA